MKRILLVLLATVTGIFAFAGFGACKLLDNSSVSSRDRSSDSGLSVGEVLYRVTSDGRYAEVAGYEGDASEVVIADTYNGLPVKGICEEAFALKEIVSVVIPEGITSIGREAFWDCYLLTDVTIPDSVTSIGEDAFYGCDCLTSIRIPKSVTLIGTGAFSACENLTSIKVAEGNDNYYSEGNCLIEKEGNRLLFGCKNSVIPKTVTSIGGKAFAYCTSLTGMTIPDGVLSIGKDAFYACDGLTDIVIPDSVTLIGEEAFENCTALERVTIGGGVTSIGAYAFSGCWNLTDILFRGTLEEWNTMEKGELWNVYVPATKVICSNGEVVL